uniref:Secreted protein n=1 Tax=Anguilla anguilla TaxID=7936 RepID=A0A0E9WU88_ANGAN
MYSVFVFRVFTGVLSVTCSLRASSRYRCSLRPLWPNSLPASLRRPAYVSSFWPTGFASSRVPTVPLRHSAGGPLSSCRLM